MSLTARTRSTGFWVIARRTLRPIRPKPLIPKLAIRRLGFELSICHCRLNFVSKGEAGKINAQTGEAMANWPGLLRTGRMDADGAIRPGRRSRFFIGEADPCSGGQFIGRLFAQAQPGVADAPGR